MSKCCASCTYLDPCTADSYGKYYCEKKETDIMVMIQVVVHIVRLILEAVALLII